MPQSHTHRPAPTQYVPSEFHSPSSIFASSKFTYFQHEARCSEHLKWVNNLAWVLYWWREFSGRPLTEFKIKDISSLIPRCVQKIRKKGLVSSVRACDYLVCKAHVKLCQGESNEDLYHVRHTAISLANWYQALPLGFYFLRQGESLSKMLPKQISWKFVKGFSLLFQKT